MPGAASRLTGSTSRLLTTFQAHNIACEVVDDGLNLIRYKTIDGEWRLLKGMVSEKLPLFSKQMCDNKWWTSRLFAELNVPTPETMAASTSAVITAFIARHGTVVIKPEGGAHGHGVTMNITSYSDAAPAIALAKTYSPNVLLQQQVGGRDIRLLTIGDMVISALERRPANVVGDGSHSVIELIEHENKKPERGMLGIDTLVEISLPAVKQFLSDSELQRIPSIGEVVRVVGPSNQSMGGTVHDITNTMPSRVTADALRLVRHLAMPIAGVDCIVTPEGYYFLEINASPGIAIHDDPALGIESECFEAYMRLLHADSW